jgi:hypothetical protein
LKRLTRFCDVQFWFCIRARLQSCRKRTVRDWALAPVFSFNPQTKVGCPIQAVFWLEWDTQRLEQLSVGLCTDVFFRNCKAPAVAHPTRRLSQHRLQILSVSIFEKTEISCALQHPFLLADPARHPNQLILFEI